MTTSKEIINPRVSLKNMVAQQLPEFIRSEYPTFVAFVEAYYEYLDNQGVNLYTLRDIDETLDDYIKHFKAELAHNYPVVSSNYDTERFLLKHIKEQYLAKGSESSYKLLFRLLYGKDVYIDYPGRQMLRVSDGRWVQDVSFYVQVLQGNPFNLIGKNIIIQTSNRIFNTKVVKNVDAANTLTATVENVLLFDEQEQIYEIFVNRNFYGDISPNDSIKYGSEFQAQLLPSTVKIKIREPGKNFKPGQVFQLASGEGTPFWFKVSTIDGNGGLKTIDVIKFGLNYKTDFSATVLPSSAVSTRKKINRTNAGSISYNIEKGKINLVEINTPGMSYSLPPILTVNGTGGTGAQLEAVLGTGANAGKVVAINVINPGSGYLTASVTVSNAPGDITGNGLEVTPYISLGYNYTFSDTNSGFTEGGYLNLGDYWDVSESGRGAIITANMGTGPNAGKVVSLNIVNGGSGYKYNKPTIDICAPLDSNGIPIDGNSSKAQAEAIITNGVITGYTLTNQGANYSSAPQIRVYGSFGYANGSYVGTINRQFFINASDTQGKDPALLDVSLGAVIKYPGYYKTNDGFLDDSMFIQDSYYYQAFAYVLKIDEQLQSYASVVRSMLHPSGMAMFGEYSINNTIPLTVALTALVKSLGVTIFDDVFIKDGWEVDENGHVVRGNYFSVYKDLSTTESVTDAIPTKYFSKALIDTGLLVSHLLTDVKLVTGKNFGTGSDATNQRVIMSEPLWKHTFTKVVPTAETVLSMTSTDAMTTKAFSKAISNTDSTVSLSEIKNSIPYPIFNISLNIPIQYVDATNFGSTGFVVFEPYDQGSYFAEIYANGRASTW